LDAPEVQYFAGKVQVSSADGKIPYGPPYESIVRRRVSALDGMVEECVLEKNKLFYTIITRTKEPLVFDAVDTDGTFSGKLIYSDTSLSAWSYDIQVVSPAKGTITGKLPEYGAVIDEGSGTMNIKKIWTGKDKDGKDSSVLLTQHYEKSDASSYFEKLKAAKIANPELVIRENCK
jgi:hypothetical protein